MKAHLKIVHAAVLMGTVSLVSACSSPPTAPGRELVASSSQRVTTSTGAERVTTISPSSSERVTTSVERRTPVTPVQPPDTWVEFLAGRCQGTYWSTEVCMDCVRTAANDAPAYLALPNADKALLIGSAEQYCTSPNKCIPWTCGLFQRTCGSIPDGCGGILVCGPECNYPPGLQRCICKDGTSSDTCISKIDCDSGVAQDVACGPVCASHGGTRATGCFQNGCTP
jgi:hypothetical protein